MALNRQLGPRAVFLAAEFAVSCYDGSQQLEHRSVDGELVVLTRNDAVAAHELSWFNAVMAS
jgi:hypothetical protein